MEKQPIADVCRTDSGNQECSVTMKCILCAFALLERELPRLLAHAAYATLRKALFALLE